ncbi:MAG: hypothetical protein ABR955_12615 [Verrucomicrobiota bacterium]|jgi:hypothetical protein
MDESTKPPEQSEDTFPPLDDDESMPAPDEIAAPVDATGSATPLETTGGATRAEATQFENPWEESEPATPSEPGGIPIVIIGLVFAVAAAAIVLLIIHNRSLQAGIDRVTSKLEQDKTRAAQLQTQLDHLSLPDSAKATDFLNASAVYGSGGTFRNVTERDISQIAGLPGTDEGLMPVSVGDGEFTIVDHEGTPCWLAPKHTPPHFFYLAKDKGFRLPPHTNFEIELEYLDVGYGVIGLDYDSSDLQARMNGVYKPHPHAVDRTNTGQWRVARFQMNDALFAGRQNGGADFRFYNGGDDLLIRAVQVRRIGTS